MSVVQRIPGGLLELLSAKTSGYTLTGLETSVRPTLDMAQFFGLSMPLETVTEQELAAAEAAGVVLTVPASEWWLLYAASATYQLTATMSVSRMSLRMAVDSASFEVVLAAGETLINLGTACPDMTGAVFVPSYPLMLPPGTRLRGTLDILGTDATAVINIQARIARLT
jgi:hypothetical protein